MDAGADFHGPLAEAAVFAVAIAERDDARFPATAGRAAREGADGVEVAVAGIGLPLRGLAAAGDDDARAQGAGFRGDGGGEVHQRGDGADHPVGVMDEADELAEVRFAAQIEDATQQWMMVARFAHLHKADAAGEVIDDGLQAPGVRPLGGEVVLAAGDDDPKTGAGAFDFLHLAEPAAFLRGEMEIAAERAGRDGAPEHRFQMLAITVNEVPRVIVAPLDKRVVHFQALALPVGDGCEVRIVLPQRRARRAHVGEVFAGIRRVQIAHGGGEHDDVAGRQGGMEDEFSHMLDSESEEVLELLSGPDEELESPDGLELELGPGEPLLLPWPPPEEELELPEERLLPELLDEELLPPPSLPPLPLLDEEEEEELLLPGPSSLPLLDEEDELHVSSHPSRHTSHFTSSSPVVARTRRQMRSGRHWPQFSASSSPRISAREKTIPLAAQGSCFSTGSTMRSARPAVLQSR